MLLGMKKIGGIWKLNEKAHMKYLSESLAYTSYMRNVSYLLTNVSYCSYCLYMCCYLTSHCKAYWYSTINIYYFSWTRCVGWAPVGSSVITTGVTQGCIQLALRWDLSYRNRSSSLRASLHMAYVHPLVYPGQHGNPAFRKWKLPVLLTAGLGSPRAPLLPPLVGQSQSQVYQFMEMASSRWEEPRGNRNGMNFSWSYLDTTYHSY